MLMYQSWKKLVSMTAGRKFLIRKVLIPEDEIEIEGTFELPPLASLSMEDQLFVAALYKNPRFHQADGNHFRNKLSHGKKPA